MVCGLKRGMPQARQQRRTVDGQVVHNHAAIVLNVGGARVGAHARQDRIDAARRRDRAPVGICSGAPASAPAHPSASPSTGATGAGQQSTGPLSHDDLVSSVPEWLRARWRRRSRWPGSDRSRAQRSQIAGGDGPPKTSTGRRHRRSESVLAAWRGAVTSRSHVVPVEGGAPGCNRRGPGESHR